MPSASLPARKQTLSHEEPLEDYADKALSHIFRVTLDPTKTTDTHGHKVTFLPGVSGELQSSGEPLKLSAATLDQALLEACGMWPADKPLLNYLLPCWKRVIRTLSSIKEAQQQRRELMLEAKRLCMSYCLFALTMPDYFG